MPSHRRWLRFRKFERRELGWLIVGLSVCLLLWGFLALASEVMEGDTKALDTTILLSLRKADDPSRPIGPAWLETAMLDLTAIGGPTVLGMVVLSVGGFLALKGRYRTALVVSITAATGVSGTECGRASRGGVSMQLRATRAVVLASVLSCAAVGTARADISTAEQKRLSEAAAVVTDLRNTAEKGIPEDIWAKAACVVVIPGMKKAAFIFGGEYGRGVMSCRTGNVWSAPAFMQLAKGSWGFQAGAEEIDLVMLVMNRRGAEKLLDNKVTLGADASVAAGPVGRSGTAGTDAALRAEILAYSRARGLFAGINLSGGALQPDKDANADAYGAASVHDVVLNGKATAPAAASDFLRTLGTTTRATTGTAPAAKTDKY